MHQSHSNYGKKSPLEQMRARFEEALRALLPCPADHVRLFRATIENRELHTKRYVDARKQIRRGTFTISNEMDKKMFDHIIHGKDKIVSRFFSDRLEACLPYFQRWNSGLKANRTLYYVDVPIERARGMYFANVETMQVGASHREDVFKKLIENAEREADAKRESMYVRNDTNERDQQEYDYLCGQVRSLELRAEDLEDLLIGHSTCNQADLTDEFFLPYHLATSKAKPVIIISGQEAACLSDEHWKEIGRGLDTACNPLVPEKRAALRNFTSDDAFKMMFGHDSHYIREMF